VKVVPVSGAAHGLAIGIGLAAGFVPDLAHRGIALDAALPVRIDRAVDAAALLVADLVRRLILQ